MLEKKKKKGLGEMEDEYWEPVLGWLPEAWAVIFLVVTSLY